MDRADESGRTPLFIASQMGRADCVELLLTAGAAVDRADEGGLTPLHFASYHGRLGCVTRLLEAGAAINRVDKLGRTPLFAAIEMGGAGCVRQLLDSNAHLNQSALFQRIRLKAWSMHDKRVAHCLALAKQQGAQRSHSENRWAHPILCYLLPFRACGP